VEILFQVWKGAVMKSSTFWDITQFNASLGLGEISRFDLQGLRVSQEINQDETCSKQNKMSVEFQRTTEYRRQKSVYVRFQVLNDSGSKILLNLCSDTCRRVSGYALNQNL
jgi:hypothetical protein